MSKASKNDRIKELEDQVHRLQTSLDKFMEYVGYNGSPYQSVIEKINIKTVNINISK